MMMFRNPLKRILGRFGLPFVLLVLLLTVPRGVQAAGQVFWDWPAGNRFQEVELDGVAVDQHGSLVPGISGQATGPTGAEVCWRIVPDGRGGFFTGTGHAGVIHHTDSQGETTEFAELSGAEVFSLLPRPGGGLWAGCGPDGELFQLDAEGHQELLGQVPGGYIWSLVAAGQDDAVWLATGSPAAVYRYTEDEGLTQWAEFPAQNVLDLLVDTDGSLLVATQGPGMVYRVDAEDPAHPWLICETRQDEVRQFLRGPDDRVFFLALNSSEPEAPAPEKGPGKNAPVPPSMLSFFGLNQKPEVEKAAIFRIEAQNRFSRWWSGDLDLMIVAWSPRWGWLGGGPLAEASETAQVHQLVPPATNYVVATWPGGDVLDLVFMEPGRGQGDLLVSQAHPGGVMRLGSGSAQTLYAFSPPLDGGGPVTWGRLNWDGVAGAGQPRWSVRCGNRSQPDESWTPWSDSWSEKARALDLPECRFLQWRVEMPPRPEGSGSAWRIHSVSVSAWQENTAPVIHDFTIENLSEVNRGGLMGMNENVTQSFASGLKVEFGRKSGSGSRAGARRAAFTRPVRVMTWDGRDANNDRLLYRLEYRRDGETNWRSVMAETREQIGSWDTSEVPDDVYWVRIVADDRLDNPGDLSLESLREAGPLQVDNTSAEISHFQVEKAAAGLRLKFRAEDKASVLAAAVVRLPDGRQERLDPVDRICDSRREDFDVLIPWPAPGRPAGEEPWLLRVEVWDLSGNVAVAEGEAK